MRTKSIHFKGKSFCFTGKLAELKRTQAEQETRARGGLTVKIVNEYLDYLVVGSIPSSGWKFGNYGRKIEAAKTHARHKPFRPVLISEDDFLEALALHECTGNGDLDSKIVVVKYRFISNETLFEKLDLEDWLSTLHRSYQCHVVSRTYPAHSYLQLFGESENPVPEEQYLYYCRMVKQFKLGESTHQFIDFVEQGFEKIKGVKGECSWFEREEGSGSYLRLINQLPSNLTVYKPT